MAAYMTAKYNQTGSCGTFAAACTSMPVYIIMDTVLLAVSILLARLVRIMEFGT